MSGALPALLALTLAMALRADDVQVTTTRVDKQHRIWVGVDNQSEDDVEVASISVRFFDERADLIDETAFRCEEDCQVGSGESSAFGPIVGPRGWESFEVGRVHYRSLDAEDHETVNEESDAEPPPPPAKPPRSEPTSAPGPPVSTPESALRTYYAFLNLGETRRARDLHTREGAVWMDAQGPAWAERETHGALVMTLTMGAASADGTQEFQVVYADGAPARRSCRLERDGAGFRLGPILPLVATTR